MRWILLIFALLTSLATQAQNPMRDSASSNTNHYLVAYFQPCYIPVLTQTVTDSVHGDSVFLCRIAIDYRSDVTTNYQALFTWCMEYSVKINANNTSYYTFQNTSYTLPPLLIQQAFAMSNQQIFQYVVANAVLNAYLKLTNINWQ